MRHVVMFSGGAGSWAAAKRVAEVLEPHERGGLVLLFADTKVESADLHDFLHAAARNIGGELVIVADGRTPFQVFHDDRFLGNARLANCSKYLKQKPCKEWIDTNCDPSTTTLHVGIDWSEVHRMPAIVAGWAPFKVSAPMCERPYMSKAGVIEWLRAEGLEPPRAYADGFPHNNCMDQGCVRGGQAYWRTMLRERRDVYLRTEIEEQDLRDYLGKDVSILRDRVGGASAPITLAAFRTRIERQPELFDHDEWGGCGCFTDEIVEAA